MHKAEVITLFQIINDGINGRFEVTPEKLTSWTMMLSDTTFEEALNNLKEYFRKGSPYAPNVSDLMKNNVVHSSVPGVEETRLMIAEREKERENHVPSNPEYVKKLIAETKAKLMEAQLNELEREHKRISQSGFGE